MTLAIGGAALLGDRGDVRDGDPGRGPGELGGGIGGGAGQVERGRGGGGPQLGGLRPG